MKYEIQFTSQFKKALKLAKKQNKDIDKLFTSNNFVMISPIYLPLKGQTIVSDYLR